jgi:hypothetical protein
VTPGLNGASQCADVISLITIPRSRYANGDNQYAQILDSDVSPAAGHGGVSRQGSSGWTGLMFARMLQQLQSGVGMR